MKRYKKYWFYLILLLSITLTILVLNTTNTLSIPKIVQDINSGVIGAILTTIITLILLSNQTESQENLTKSSVVYEEKLKIFNGFLQTIGNCLEDGKFTAQETTQIIHSFSILRIHISNENAVRLEHALKSIDNSFFYCDENGIPNLTRLSELYTDLTNVFRQELYGEGIKGELQSFNFENLKNVLYRKRLSIHKPNSYNELVAELKNHSKILHTSNKTGITIVFDINDELIFALDTLNELMVNVISRVSSEIEFTYEINRQIINNEMFSGIPWIKLYYKDNYFAFYGITETKRLWIGKNCPEPKQVASLEIFELDKLEKLQNQITTDFKNLIISIDNQNK